MDLESAHVAICVTEKNRTSIILSLYQGHLVHFPVPVAAAVVKMLAESASVPAALALDYSKNSDYIRQASHAGSSELTTDASAFPLEENVCQTRVMMELVVSAQFRAEGGPGHLADVPCCSQAVNTDLVAQSTDVEPSIVQTDIGLLAVSAGTVHGTYVPGVVPAIDFRRLAEILRCSSVPLALHGGSGTPFDQLQLHMTLGVIEINMEATVFERGKSALLHTLCHDISIELVDVLKTMGLAFEGAITSHLQTSGSIGKT